MRPLTDIEITELKEKLRILQDKRGIDKLRVAIYARKSAEDERQTSLETQITNCKDFLADYDFFHITHVLQEDNVSGMFTDNRTQYQKAMSLAEQGEIDVLVVMRLDRLARDLGDASTSIKLLNIYHCHLIAGDDVSNPNTASGELMRSILLAQNQYLARYVASNVMSAECNNVKNAKSAGSSPPYGLKVVAKRFEINEDEAPAIRLMFKRIASGASYQDVIDELTRLGYRTRKGNTFSKSALNSLLRNEKYYGTYVYNRATAKKRKHRVLLEHFDEVRNPNAIPPIVTKQLFDKVQAVLNQRKAVKPRQNANPAYVLTDLLYCKQCGHSFSGYSCTSGRTHTHYRTYSHTRKQRETCKANRINAEYLETAVKDIILSSINSHFRTSPLSKTIYERLEHDVSERIATLSRRISELESNIKACMSKAINPNTPTMLVSRYEQQATDCITAQEQKRADIQLLQDKLERIRSIKECSDSTYTLTAEDIFPTDAITRETIRIFIKRIEIDEVKDTIDIIFHD